MREPRYPLQGNEVRPYQITTEAREALKRNSIEVGEHIAEGSLSGFPILGFEQYRTGNEYVLPDGTRLALTGFNELFYIPPGKTRLEALPVVKI